eukprot:CAMPEP_0197635530 /NCGR_PEP_ID=MMETSP1338-20131121/11328_1 /TAXON_ID=43686 ORGANISM="Pelagodinium beii, Strain RCC1491" /NCGR_SAMPLE_ID=MMETSP1338 /ASSEMBLY_ACC=CAM_ASM_000754 /LENGTH=60 /DNA_ID=CAMNT_0043207605 /DNA_START=1 /DNA_END=180 /DNA_ORIENTATION=+
MMPGMMPGQMPGMMQMQQPGMMPSPGQGRPMQNGAPNGARSDEVEAEVGDGGNEESHKFG